MSTINEKEAINYDMLQINFGKSKNTIDRGTFNENAHGRANDFLHMKHKAFAFLELDKVNTESSNFWNTSIRSGPHSDDAIAEMQNSIRDSWSTDYPLPVVDEDGMIVDGRTRIKAAIENGEDYVPVQVVERAPSESIFLANAIKSNCLHKPARAAAINDFVAGYVEAWRAGQVGDSKEEIESFLKDAGIDERWPPGYPWNKGVQTNTLNKCAKRVLRLKRIANNCTNETVVVKSKTEMQKIAMNSLPFGTNYVVVSASYDADVPRIFWNSVVENLQDSKKVGYPKIILYVHHDCSPDEYDLAISKFCKSFHKVYDDMFYMISANTDINIKNKDKDYWLQTRKRPYEIIGVIPQVENRPSHMNGNILSNTKIVKFDGNTEENTVDSDSLFS